MPSGTTKYANGEYAPGSVRGLASVSVESLAPRQITAIYLAFGLGALFLSDLILLWLLSDPLLRQVQAVKGLLEVLFTAGLIYVLTTSSQRTLRRNNAVLERNREELSVLHRLLRHNLRNDLTLIRGEAERLQEHLGEENADACDAVITATDEIIEDADRAQAIRKLTERGRHQVDLTAVVSSVATAAGERMDGVRIHTSGPDTAPVVVNDLFDHALLELLTNAGVHVGERAEIDVTVEPDSDRPGMTCLEVSDDGPGLPEHVAAALRGEHHDQLVHLDGLGLWFAYLTVVESGGEFAIPEHENGTTIRMYLQTAPTGPAGRFDRIRARLGVK